MEEAVARRAEQLFKDHSAEIFRRTDRFMSGLLLLQWLAIVLVAVTYSPLAWAWDQSHTHLHLGMSLGLGALIVLPPVLLAWKMPGVRLTRMSLAMAQMLISAVFIHLSGGRIESHFHIFASLAILSLYRDWEVFVPATVVIALDHALRGAFFPMSVYGVASAGIARTLEHAWWVLFEDAFLVWACLQAQRDMRQMAQQQAVLEALKSGMEESVSDRTRELQESQSSLKKLVDMLTGLMSQIQVAGIQVAGAATAISATARQQQASVGHQAAAATEIRSASHQISTTARELSQTMNDVSQAAEGAADMALTGNRALDDMQSRFRQMVEASSAVVSKLAILSEKATSINSVVTVITRVADQTNLLSLNAAIEAEKAGDYGRGFGVVATEIRRLADQTAVATLDIETMVKGIQSAVSAGVMEMDKFREDVRQSEDSVSQVVQLLLQITDRVASMRDRYDQVNVGMRSQAQGAVHISESIGHLSESAQEAANNVVEFGQVVQQLQDATQKLQSSVSSFKEAETGQMAAVALAGVSFS
jgi:methyl-accepting chemotaxis protein